MTITSQFATIANSIAALNIPGVTIKDIDNIPDSASMLTPLLIPQPNDFITDLSATFQTFGTGGTAKMDMNYTMNYVYLHAEAGSGLSTYEIYAGLISKLSAIIEEILANDKINGLVDFQLRTIGNIGVISDPADNEFWGALVSFRVLEFAQ